MTPLEKLASLPDVHKLLRQGTTLEHLQALAQALTDIQAAEELNEARPGPVPAHPLRSRTRTKTGRGWIRIRVTAWL